LGVHRVDEAERALNKAIELQPTVGAMGIEPTGKAVLGPENKRFAANADAKCD
jgi:hypothetical protein